MLRIQIGPLPLGVKDSKYMWLKERHRHIQMQTPCVLNIAGYDTTSQLQGIQGFETWSETVASENQISMSWPSEVDHVV